MGFSSGIYSTFHEGNGYEWSESHSARYDGPNALAILNNAGKENEYDAKERVDKQVRQLGLQIRADLQAQGFEIKANAISDQLIMEVLHEHFPALPPLHGWTEKQMYQNMRGTFWFAFHYGM